MFRQIVSLRVWGYKTGELEEMLTYEDSNGYK